MLKPPSETSELLDRIKCLLTLSKDCKVKSNVLKNWNTNIDLLITDPQLHNLIKDLLKSSNNNTKLNMLLVSTQLLNISFLVKNINILFYFSSWHFQMYQKIKC